MNIFLYLFNPLIAFIQAMKSLNKAANGLVFVAFYALFGYAISFNLTTADSYRIAARFCQTEFLFDEVWFMYRAGELTDVYLIFVYSIVKIFTYNPKVLYGVLGSVMGVFSYLSIRQLYDVWHIRKNRYFYLIVFIYFLSISFFNVNGIRFWTATSFCSYFLIQFFYFKKRYAIIGVIATPLIHFGYLVAVIFILIYLLFTRICKNVRVFYIIFVLSFLIMLAMPQSAVDDIMGSGGDVEALSSNSALNTKYKNYSKTSENNEKSRQQELNRNSQSLYREANSAYTKLFDWVYKVGMFVMLSFLYLKRKYYVQSKTQFELFKLILFVFSFSYVATVLIASGGRFLRLACMLFSFWFLLVYQNNVSKQWNGYAQWLIPINFYAISFLFVNAPRLVTPLFWFAPPFVTILDGIGFAPIDFL